MDPDAQEQAHGTRQAGLWRLHSHKPRASRVPSIIPGGKATHGAPAGVQPAGTLTSASVLQSCEGLHLCCSKPSSCGALLWKFTNEGIALQKRTSSATRLPCQKDQMRSQRRCFSVSRCHDATVHRHPAPCAVQSHP